MDACANSVASLLVGWRVLVGCTDSPLPPCRPVAVAQEARDGLRLALSDYRGEFVVVLFYPIKQFPRFRNFSERSLPPRNWL